MEEDINKVYYNLNTKYSTKWKNIELFLKLTKDMELVDIVKILGVNLEKTWNKIVPIDILK